MAFAEDCDFARIKASVFVSSRWNMNEKEGPDDGLRELALQAASGDLQAQEELFNHPKFHKMVDIQCRSVRRGSRGCGAVRELADLKQATYLRIYQFLPKFNGGSPHADGKQCGNPFAAWIHQIARNIYLREEDKENRGHVEMEHLARETPQDVLEVSPEMVMTAMRVYQGLTPKERKIFDLHVEGFNAREITEAIYPLEWQSWDKTRRKNEPEKVRKKVVSIQKRFMAALGLDDEQSRSAGA
jgi:DNA-directed RNA polymerase specialized sigma24 family protein